MIRKTFFLIASLLLIGGGNSWADQYPDKLYAGGLSQVDDVYQIGTAQDLIDFKDIVNNGTNCAANAVLTSDIDMKDQSWTPIGQHEKDYKGHFDGQGHRIKNLIIDNTFDNQALFGQAVGGAIIENVIIDASCSIKGRNFPAGILGHVWGDGVIVRNCGNEASITAVIDGNQEGGKNAAGIVGCSERKVYISHCYNTGSISGDRECAGICAWMGDAGSTMTCCFSSGNVTNGDGLYRYFDGWEGASNNYQINGSQGTVFTNNDLRSGKLAYLINAAAGSSVWYQNIGVDSHPFPFQNGVNSTVYQHNSSIYSNLPSDKYVDGYFQLSSATDLELFAGMVNVGYTNINGKLTTDIDMTNEGWTPIGGEGHKYCGTFDGQGHMIDHLVLDNSGYDSQGIFGQVGGSIDADECIIKNLIAGPNNSIKGNKWVGGLIGCADGNGTIKLINCGQEGYVEAVNENAAAMIGCMKSCALYLENCYNIGNIKGGSESAIISGWLAGHKYHTISGFYNTGSIYGEEEDHTLFRNQDGNNNWADIPYSDFSKYENVYHIYAHQGATQVAIDADYYQIGDGKQLKWFAYWTRTGNNTTAKGMLTANIDMKDIDFPCIGSDSKKFAGELVGDGAKIISNLTINENGNDVGLVRVATGGARVKNITIDASCSIKGGSQVGAIIGTLNGGGDVYVENCGNEAPVEGTHHNVGGLVGAAFSSTIGNFTNCYNVGSVKSGIPGNAAGLTFNTDGAVFTRCYSYLNSESSGMFENKWFTNTGSYTATTCYGNNSSSNTDITDLSAATMANGTLQTNLGSSYYPSTIYGANAHPGFAQQVTMKLAETDDNTMPASDLAGQHVILNRALVADNWNTICLPFDLGDLEVWFGAGTKAAEFSSELGGVLHFTLVTSLSANTPYLLYPTENKTSMTFSGITIQSGGASFSSPAPSNYTFRGIYSPTSITGNYFIASDNKIKQSTGGNLKAFRAYIESSETEAHELSFDFEDAGIATGISDATRLNDNGQMINDNYYDLSGRRVENPTRGLYIVNGKKVNIK